MATEKKVLIIDDEFPIRYMVEHQLRRHGFAVCAAKDGAEGLRAAQIYKPDLIVLDVMMPQMDGFEVCERIRHTSDIATTPIIFLTACATKEQKLQAFDAGADDYLVKPFMPDELLAHITAVLRRFDQKKGPESVADAPQGHIISLYSPKGGVGTTTLAIQLSEAAVIRADRPVVLIDLDLPLGGIAPMLNLYTNQHIASLLDLPSHQLNMTLIRRVAQRHRANLLVIPAPGKMLEAGQVPQPKNLKRLLDIIVAEGYQIVIDAGSELNELTLEALRLSDFVYVVTSGQPVANRLHNAFTESAKTLQLEPRRLLPVINELHGPVKNVELSRVPVARIPHANERSRTRLWLRDQGMEKLVSIML